MANFIDEAVVKMVVGMLSDHLYEEREKIDDLYGDESDNRNRKITVNLKCNLSQKGSGIEAKTTIDYVLVAATPAKKHKNTKKRIWDTKQKKLFTEENQGDKGK